MGETEMASFRLPADLATALRKYSEERGETLSDTMRRAALALLGTCPTCEHRTSLWGHEHEGGGL